MNTKPYFDVDFYDNITFPNSNLKLTLSTLGLELPILSSLCKLLPDGSKFILGVTGQDEVHRETFDALNKGVPIEATYLGSVLLRADCGIFFKDWLIREGGREGPAAIQVEKAIDMASLKVAKEDMKTRLRDFIIRSKTNDRVVQRCVERALAILSSM